MIHISLGTNDDPNDVAGFRAAVRDVIKVAGSRRCVVWTNIVRPKAAGATYAGYNRVLAQEDGRRKNLRVVNWVRMVRQHPEWLVGDGVHVNADGYKARAKAVARSVRECHCDERPPLRDAAVEPVARRDPDARLQAAPPQGGEAALRFPPLPVAPRDSRGAPCRP